MLFEILIFLDCVNMQIFYFLLVDVACFNKKTANFTTNNSTKESQIFSIFTEWWSHTDNLVIDKNQKIIELNTQRNFMKNLIK
jgi:hypothetical protein